MPPWERDEARIFAERLPLVSAHCALIVARNALGAQRVTHLLRKWPAFKCSVDCGELDEELQKAVQKALNIPTKVPSRRQARPPGRMGGLGPRRAADLAFGALE